jgi:hypothetical protein
VATSISGTLDGGDGGTPPRPSDALTFGTNGSYCKYYAFLDVYGTSGNILGLPILTLLSFAVQAGPTPPVDINTQAVIAVEIIGNDDGTSNTVTLTASSFNSDTPLSGTLTHVYTAATGMKIPFNITTIVQVTSEAGGEARGDILLSLPDLPSVIWTNVVLFSGATGPSIFAGAFVEAVQGGLVYAINGAPSNGEEIIFLNDVSPVLGQALAIGGSITGTIAAALQYWLDGETGGEVTSYMPGTLWTGVGPVATTGTHTLYVQDPNSLVVSNTVSFVVGAAALTLDPITAQSEVPPAISGIDNESPVATSLDVQVGPIGGTLSAWTLVTGFEPAGAPAGTWHGFGLPEPPGTYTAQVRNHDLPDVLSNVETYVICSCADNETIQLATATGTLNGLVQLMGTSSDGPPQAIDVSLDGGVTWAQSTTYTTTNGTIAAPWAATGPTLE